MHEIFDICRSGRAQKSSSMNGWFIAPTHSNSHSSGQSAPPAMLALRASAPPAYCSAAAADSAPRPYQQLSAQRRQHRQLARPDQLEHAAIPRKAIEQRRRRETNRDQTAQRQLQHGGQDGRAGQRAAPHVSEIAAQRPQHRRFPPAQHEIGHVCRVCNVPNDRSLASHHAFGRLCLRLYGNGEDSLAAPLCSARLALRASLHTALDAAPTRHGRGRWSTPRGRRF